jgi:hypothetical protein
MLTQFVNQLKKLIKNDGYVIISDFSYSVMEKDNFFMGWYNDTYVKD